MKKLLLITATALTLSMPAFAATNDYNGRDRSGSDHQWSQQDHRGDGQSDHRSDRGDYDRDGGRDHNGNNRGNHRPDHNGYADRGGSRGDSRGNSWRNSRDNSWHDNRGWDRDRYRAPRHRGPLYPPGIPINELGNYGYNYYGYDDYYDYPSNLSLGFSFR